MLVEVICRQIVRVMGLEEDEQIDPQQPLQELGLDSLMAVELRNILCVLSGKQLAATLLFKYPSVDALSEFLIQDMFGEEADAEGQSVPQSQLSIQQSSQLSSQEQSSEESFDDLSDEALAALLEAELDN
jgi:acyl carrier protein